MEENNIISELKIIKEKNENYLGLINVLLEENKKLRNDLTKYELIKVIMNDDGTKPLVRPREEVSEEKIVSCCNTCEAFLKNKGVDIWKKTEAQKHCVLCKRDDLDLSELPWQTKEKYYTCDSCREEIEEDNHKVQESKLKTNKLEKTRKHNGRKARVNNKEALKHAKPSKNKGKSICLECNKEFLTQYFHSHYAIHVK